MSSNPGALRDDLASDSVKTPNISQPSVVPSRANNETHAMNSAQVSSDTLVNPSDSRLTALQRSNLVLRSLGNSEAKIAHTGNVESSDSTGRLLFYTDRSGTQPQVKNPAGASEAAVDLAALLKGSSTAASGAIGEGTSNQNHASIVNPGAFLQTDGRPETRKRPRESSPSADAGSPIPKKKQERSFCDFTDWLKSPNNPENRRKTPHSRKKGAKKSFSQNSGGAQSFNNLDSYASGQGNRKASRRPNPFGTFASQTRQPTEAPTTFNSYLIDLPQIKREDIGPSSATKARVASQVRDKMVQKTYNPEPDYDKEIKQTIKIIERLRRKYDSRCRIMAREKLQLSKENWDMLKGRCDNIPDLDTCLHPFEPVLVEMPDAAEMPNAAAEADRVLDEIAADLDTDPTTDLANEASQSRSAADLANEPSQQHSNPAPVSVSLEPRINTAIYGDQIEILVEAMEFSSLWDLIIELRKAVDKLTVHLARLRAEKARDTDYCQWLRQKQLDQLLAGRMRQDLSGDEGQEVQASKWDDEEDDSVMAPFVGTGH